MIALALRLHGSARGHRDFTLQSMREHVEEVRMLLERDDEHWKAETADILIHCLLLLRAAGVDDQKLDELVERRLGRFREKISAALGGK